MEVERMRFLIFGVGDFVAEKAASMLRLMRSAVTWARMLPTLDLT